MELALRLKHNDIDDVSEALWSLFLLWTETDSIENEFEVAPVVQYEDFTHSIGEQIIYVAVYIAAQFIFHNQTRWEGYIRYNGDVTAFTVFDKDNKRTGHTLVPVYRETFNITSKTFADEIGMNVKNIFPIVYCSKIRYGDRWIAGVIEE